MNEDRPDQKVKIKVTDKRVIADEGEDGAAAVQQDAPRDELAEARALADERYEQLLRLKADFENYRQRMLREQTEAIERASHRIVERLVPVLDDFERALEHVRESAADEALVKGVELVLKRLHEVLAGEGLERVEAQGQPFDPHEHEAMSSMPGEVAEPTVLEVVRPGYKLKGRGIRPALVVVQTPAEVQAPPEQEPEGG